MNSWSSHSQAAAAAQRPPLRRPYLPCVPAPVYRTRVAPRVSAALQTGSPSPEQRSVLLTQTPSTVRMLSAAAANEPGTSFEDSEAVSNIPESVAPALSRSGGSASLKEEEGPEFQPEPEPEQEPEQEAEAGLKSELQLESGGPGPHSDPGAKASPQSELPGTSGRSKLRRNRTVFSLKQVSTLEKAFQKNPYPSFEDTIQLAQELRITEVQVKVWFQNRRKKLKRQLQEKSQFFAPTHSAPFGTLGSPLERLQPDYHTYPFPHGQTLASSSTYAPSFGPSLYTSQDLGSLGFQMPYYHPNFSSRSLSSSPSEELKNLKGPSNPAPSFNCWGN